MLDSSLCRINDIPRSLELDSRSRKLARLQTFPLLSDNDLKVVQHTAIMGLVDILEFLVVLITSYVKAFYRLLSPPPKKSVEGQIAVVTGGGHGIGREIALGLAKAGAIVVIWDINKEGSEETAKMVTEGGGQAHSFTVDVSSIDQIAACARKIRQDIGEVSILINNAGVINVANFFDLSEKAIRKTFDVNTFAQFWTVREFLPSMLDKKVGHIVNIASMASFHGTQLMTDYSASKFASRGFSDALRRELRGNNQSFVKVTCVCPMYVETGFISTMELSDAEKLTPQQVAEATVDGMLRDKNIVFVPGAMEFFTRIGGIFPQAVHEYIGKKTTMIIKPQNKKVE